MSHSTIKTLIVDDHLLFAEGLSLILQDLPQFEIVQIIHSYQEVSQIIAKTKIDLILLDIKLKEQNGIEICRLIKELHPQIKVVLISMFDPQSLVMEIRQCKADGYIPKSTDARILKQTIQSIAQGEKIFLDIGNKSVKESPAEKLLTSREKEIIAMIKQGKSAKEISSFLHISTYTVDTHRRNILKKLDLHSVKDLIAFSFNNNL